MSSYATSHISPEGPGDSRPTALQIIQDQGLEGKLVGKVMVITGASSGIGLETARALSATGATLFLCVRNLKSAGEILSDILEPGRVSMVEMDLGSFASIRIGAATILEESKGQVNILVNNAGVLGFQNCELSENGHELHFATNYLAAFLLFELLKPTLLASSTPTFHSRVVNVSSSSHRAYGINESGNYSFQQGGYNPFLAYSQAATAKVYMANEIERRYSSKGLHATSVHPGSISTNLSRHLGPAFAETFTKDPVISKTLKSPEQGAATTVMAAVGKKWESKGGRYLEDCDEAKRGKDDWESLGTGYVSHTYDQEKEGRLWSDSTKIVGVDDDVKF